MRISEEAKGLLKLITKAGAQPIGRQLRRKERAMQRDVDAEFEKQKDFIVKRAKALVGKGLKRIERKDIDSIFDNLDDTEMIDKIIVVAGTTMNLGAKYRIQKSKLAQIGISFDLDHPLAVEYLKKHPPACVGKNETDHERPH